MLQYEGKVGHKNFSRLSSAFKNIHAYIKTHMMGFSRDVPIHRAIRLNKHRRVSVNI